MAVNRLDLTLVEYVSLSQCNLNIYILYSIFGIVVFYLTKTSHTSIGCAILIICKYTIIHRKQESKSFNYRDTNMYIYIHTYIETCVRACVRTYGSDILP